MNFLELITMDSIAANNSKLAKIGLQLPARLLCLIGERNIFNDPTRKSKLQDISVCFARV
jgi:hypothetical protein